MKILLFGHGYGPSRLDQVCMVLKTLLDMPVELLAQRDFYEYLSETLPEVCQGIGVVDCCANCEVDMAMSLGGDGTFLRATQKIGDRSIPILGVNIGRLGFLADVPAEEVGAVLAEILAGDYTIENRTLLRVESDALPEEFWSYALNEVALLKVDTSSMVTIHVSMGDNFLNSYQSDGLIVATPTGSTAYSMSVGGPILLPQAANWVISPVAPHSLTVRPLVVNDDMVISLRVDSRNHSFLLSLDGRSIELDTDTPVVLRKAPFAVRIIKRKGHSFSETLRAKLMWGVDKRE